MRGGRSPGTRSTRPKEWDTRDADEAGQSLDVYVGGEYQAARARVSGLVPTDLAAAALWLVNGLDGTR